MNIHRERDRQDWIQNSATTLQQLEYIIKFLNLIVINAASIHKQIYNNNSLFDSDRIYGC